MARIGNFAVSPDSKWVAFSKQDRTLRVARLHRADRRRRGAARLRRSRCSTPKRIPSWTADGRYLVFTSSEGFSNGIATQGGITTTTELWAVPLRDQDRDPLNRDIDNEAQALAAQAAGGGGRGGAGGAPAAVTVQIDWNNMARRARQIPRAGRCDHAACSPSPTGASVAFNLSSSGGAGGAAARRPARPASTS